jgi:putative copper export protein
VTVLLYVHLIAATVWVGGLIVMAGLVPSIRASTDDRTVIQNVAKRFGLISWTALTVLVLTGMSMVLIGFNLSTALTTKIGLVLVSAVLAAWHTVSASSQTPRTRGLIQAMILVLGLIIVGIAINL